MVLHLGQPMVGWEGKVSIVLYLLWPEPELCFTLGAAYGGVGGEGSQLGGVATRALSPAKHAMLENLICVCMVHF